MMTFICTEPQWQALHCWSQLSYLTISSPCCVTVILPTNLEEGEERHIMLSWSRMSNRETAMAGDGRSLWLKIRHSDTQKCESGWRRAPLASERSCQNNGWPLRGASGLPYLYRSDSGCWHSTTACRASNLDTDWDTAVSGTAKWVCGKHTQTHVLSRTSVGSLQNASQGQESTTATGICHLKKHRKSNKPLTVRWWWQRSARIKAITALVMDQWNSFLKMWKKVHIKKHPENTNLNHLGKEALRP